MSLPPSCPAGIPTAAASGNSRGGRRGDGIVSLSCVSKTWDITKLAGPVKGKYFDCYMMVDIHSRFIVGAHVHAT